MTGIALKTYELAREKFAYAFEQLDKDIDNPFRALLEDDDEDEFKLDSFLDDEELLEENEREKNVFKKLRDELDAYCRQTVVLGFNSAKYDMNLIKTHLAKTLNMHEPGQKFTVKRNNSYACLANETFKFLDITSYFAPGFSYAKFLKAFDVTENKGFFPYEWFDSVDKLNHPTLPSHEQFYSSLKECFPGLARRMLFDTGRRDGASFALFDDANSDLYFTLKNNLIGGPSIIFNRHHEVGQTFIRNDFTRPCQKILGFDANALYLYCIDQEMPTGSFVRRRVEDGFKPQKRDKYTLMYDWMDYLNHTRGLDIKHKLNTGKEKKIGSYPVDGYDANTNTVYQFHGCYWHGHDCWMTKNVKDQKWRETRQAKYDKTIKTTTFIQAQGYNIVEKWECHFRNDIERHGHLKSFCDSRKPATPQRSVTETEILKGVASGRLFGMVECDIRVPDEWPSYF
ncbi:unnamed protein product [Mytilus edulis]|uniref:DNA-directed DNA polymerase n=1 Tax=Mytilus edulis TaxID=6550 RepID=A0A8S3SK69_MYTED|nr:unnamed protein product [Mytilus edulis]